MKVLGHRIDVVGFNSTLRIMVQVHFYLCSFRLGQLGEGMVKFSRRAVRQSASTTPSHCDSMMEEANGSFSVLLRVRLTHFLQMISTGFRKVAI